MQARRPPRYARLFVVVLVCAMIGCAAATVEAWPFSAWRLFSTLRTDEQHGWAATIVLPGGAERDFPIGALGDGNRGFTLVLNGFASRPQAERDAICRTWVREAASYTGGKSRAVRIYALTWRLSEEFGDSPRPPSRTLAWTCTTGGARAAG
jgi:hypothetical protein